MANVYVIRPLPVGNSPTARAERSHLQASRWAIKGAPGDGAVAGKPYSVDEETARNLIRKGWVLCDSTGKPTDDELAEPKENPIRNGTAEWYALPPDQRPGTEEYRQAELQRNLDKAWQEEQAAEAAKNAAPAVQPLAGSGAPPEPPAAGSDVGGEPPAESFEAQQRRTRK